MTTDSKTNGVVSSVLNSTFDHSLVSLLDIHRRLPKERTRRLVTVDSHTGGELTRVIIGGAPHVPGDTVAAKRQAMMASELDHIRRLVTHEPRGHKDVVAALITEPTSEDADFGVIFMDACRYPYSCGTATVGAVTTMVELGLVQPDPSNGAVVVDTPAGKVRTWVGKTPQNQITIELVPSFVYAADQIVGLPGADKRVDIVFVGGFLVLIDAEQLPTRLLAGNAAQIALAGRQLLFATNRQLPVAHPHKPEVNTVDGVVFYDRSGHREHRGFGTVVYGADHVDRSPCGTGTTAVMTLLHRRGQLGVGQTFMNEGLLGTVFRGELVRESMVANYAAVVGHITTRAHLVGLAELFVDPADPFADGFLMG